MANNLRAVVPEESTADLEEIDLAVNSAPCPDADPGPPAEDADHSAQEVLEDFMAALLDLPGRNPGNTCLWHDIADVLPDAVFERIQGWLEKALENDLRGVPGHIRRLTDVKRRGIDSQLETGARPGSAITLTIDDIGCPTFCGLI